MFSYEQIARWLPSSYDPITIEDWIANRELFGVDPESPKELEYAYVTEQIRNKNHSGDVSDLPLEILLNTDELVGVVDRGDELVVIPTGKAQIGQVAMQVELGLDVEKPKKMNVMAGEILVVPVLKRNQLKVKVWAKGKLNFEGKGEASFLGGGKMNLIFDGRGRPVEALNSEAAQLKVMKIIYDRPTAEIETTNE